MKRLFSLILAVLMITGTLMITTYASDESPYTDVKEGKWFYEAVMEAYDKGLMLGSDGKFRPNATMNRAEMVTLISRLAGVDLNIYPVTKKFKDVGLNNWYSAVVCWASDEGLVGGYEDRTFKPTAPVKRQELAKMIVGLIDYLKATVPDAEDAAEPFKDFSKIQSWAKDYVESLRKTGLVKGDNMGNFNPLKTATRAEVATIAVRLDPFLKGELSVQQHMDKFAEGVCGAHGQYHVTMGYSSEFTAENFEKYIVEWMGLDPTKYAVTVDPAGVEASLPDYQAEGEGSSVTVDLEIVLKSLETGEESERTPIKFYVTKFPDGVGAMQTCRDDHVQDAILENLDSYFDLDNDGRIKIPLGGGATFTRENISNIVMEKVGLDPRVYALIISDNGANTFDEAKEGHSGICHGQVHDREFTVAIRDLAQYRFLGGEDGEPDSSKKSTTEEYTWRFWFSKDITAVYDSILPANGSTVTFAGSELTKEALDAEIRDFVTSADSMCGDFTVYDYDFDALKAAFDGGAATANVHIKFTIPTEDFTFGNPAELPDTVLERDYTIAVPAGVKDYGEGAQIKIDLKPVEKVTVDGVISDGEYYKVESDKIFKVEKPNSADYKTDVTYYVSYSGNKANFAAEVSASKFAQNTTFEGGRCVGDDAIIAGTSFVMNTLIPNGGDVTKANAYDAILYYAVSKATSDGSYNEGTYGGQVGESVLGGAQYDPEAEKDYVINYADGKVVVEWSVPLKLFHAAGTELADGTELYATFAVMNGEGNSWDSANSVYGQGIGQMVPFADSKDQIYPAVLVLKDYVAPDYTTKDYGDGAQIKIDLKKAVEDVKIDGVIYDGEYFKVETENVFKVQKPSSSDYTTDVTYYVSHSDDKVNFAAEVTASNFAQNTTFEGGRCVGDDAIIAGTSFVMNTLLPKEGADFTKKEAYDAILYYAVSKATSDGSYNEGTYGGQVGESVLGGDQYDPEAGVDYVINYTDGKIIFEWSLPMDLFHAAGTELADGTELYITFAVLNGEGNGWDSANSVYGQGIGQMVPFADGKDQIYPAILVINK